MVNWEELNKPRVLDVDSCRTFAYILCAASMTSEDLESLPWRGDLIEFAMSTEDQAQTVDSLSWPWSGTVVCVAPVQLARGWDPRPSLTAALSGAAQPPTGRNRVYAGTPVADWNVIYSAPLQKADVSRVAALEGPDQARFVDVLSQAVSKALGLLFVGDWGWDYEANNSLPDHVVALLRAKGLTVLSRHL